MKNSGKNILGKRKRNRDVGRTVNLRDEYSFSGTENPMKPNILT